MGVIGIVRFAAACTLRALESASAGALDGPDESGPRGEKASTIAFSMELPTSRIEFLVSIAASAGIASIFVVASAISFCEPKLNGRILESVNIAPRILSEPVVMGAKSNTILDYTHVVQVQILGILSYVTVKVHLEFAKMLRVP